MTAMMAAGAMREEEESVEEGNSDILSTIAVNAFNGGPAGVNRISIR
jgi:hypothetical protein